MITGLGAIEVRRTYFYCQGCRLGEYAADHALGIVATLTRRARELICLSGLGSGFATAAKRLARFCGWNVSPQSMRRACEQEGVRIENWRGGGEEASTNTDCEKQENSDMDTDTDTDADHADRSRFPCETLRNFREAEGLIEFSADGTSVNTVEGWRELRIALWQKRPLAQAVEPHEWNTRSVPKPTASTVLIDMAPADQFGARWRGWLYDLGIRDTATITVLADGAEWIWNQAAIQFPAAEGVLDIYHASEHIAQAARAIFGDNQGAVLAWTDVGALWLLRDGWTGICRWVARVREASGQQEPALQATENLVGYLAKHLSHLKYRQRLREGKSIGSGPVEGAAKQLVGRRLKQTGARWQPKNAIAMATLVSAEWAGDWDRYWRRNCPNQNSSLALAV